MSIGSVAALMVDLVLILFLILLSGFLVMVERAVIAARRARPQRQQQANQGDTGTRAAVELARAPSHRLSPVRLGITLVGILVGAVGGATIAQDLAAVLQAVPAVAPYSEALGIGIVVLGLTFLSLILGELVPKQLALLNAEGIATAAAGPLRGLSRIAAPAVRAVHFLTDTVLRGLGMPASAAPPVTHEEIKVLLEQGTQAGGVEEAERQMIESVLRLREQRVEMLMTPQKDIVWLELHDAPDALRRTVIESARSRFPVGQESLDNALGIVEAKDFLAASLEGQPVDLKAMLRPQKTAVSTLKLCAVCALRLHRLRRLRSGRTEKKER